MKTLHRRLIIGAAAVFALGLTAWYYTFWSCGHLSGFESDAWGGNAKACMMAGCRVRIVNQVKTLPNTFDTSGYNFRCVPGLGL
jgi:hypothetical protein